MVPIDIDTWHCWRANMMALVAAVTLFVMPCIVVERFEQIIGLIDNV
jgi:hypothetical protein